MLARMAVKTYIVRSHGVRLGDESFDRDETFDRDLASSEKWLEKHGHIEEHVPPADPPAEDPPADDAAGDPPADDAAGGD